MKLLSIANRHAGSVVSVFGIASVAVLAAYMLAVSPPADAQKTSWFTQNRVFVITASAPGGVEHIALFSAKGVK